MAEAGLAAYQRLQKTQFEALKHAREYMDAGQFEKFVQKEITVLEGSVNFYIHIAAIARSEREADRARNRGDDWRAFHGPNRFLYRSLDGGNVECSCWLPSPTRRSRPGTTCHP